MWLIIAQKKLFPAKVVEKIQNTAFVLNNGFF
jgi:hypothetical protein